MNRVGFIGLGAMGAPMAANLASAGVDLLLWNRTREKASAIGAPVAGDVDELFARSETVLLMLADEPACDAVLARAAAEVFQARVRGRTVVHMGTTSPTYSRALELAVQAAGGRYVEAPVSGSRGPARDGRLIGMLAGDARAVADVRPLVEVMCASTVVCGDVPGATLMKLAVNVFLIALVTGLAEAMHFARAHELDVGRLVAVLAAGPMASEVSRGKARKLAEGDLRAQASVSNVLENNRLIAEAARAAGIASPLIDVCHRLFADAQALGLGDADMIAVHDAIAALR